MTEIAVENKLCSSCGAEIRAEALFCYNCGGAVQKGADDDSTEGDVSEVWLRGELEISKGKEGTDEDELGSNTGTEPEINEKKKSDIESGLKSDEATVLVKPELEPSGSPKLKTAASLRKKPKTARRRKVVVDWKEKENSVNIWFIVGSIAITLLVGTLFALAVYLK